MSASHFSFHRVPLARAVRVRILGLDAPVNKRDPTEII